MNGRRLNNQSQTALSYLLPKPIVVEQFPSLSSVLGRIALDCAQRGIQILCGKLPPDGSLAASTDKAIGDFPQVITSFAVNLLIGLTG